MLYLFGVIRNLMRRSNLILSEVFSRNSSCEVIRYARNVPLGVLEKCCIFLERLKIEYGRSDLTFPEAFSSCFFPPEILHMKSPDMPEIFL